MSAASIPFRADPAVDGMQVVGILLVTVLLLAATLMLLAYARRKGWLERWRVGKQPPGSRNKKNAWAVDSQRISRQTTVHTLSDGKQQWVIVESTVHVALAEMQKDGSGKEVGRDAE